MMPEPGYAPPWEDIEEEEPDSIDIQMLDAIRNDPDCHEFTNDIGVTSTEPMQKSAVNIFEKAVNK